MGSQYQNRKASQRAHIQSSTKSFVGGDSA